MKRYLWICVLLTACGFQENRQLDDALALAGDNRRELQKALDYFSGDAGDSLKLKACEFLIANMPGHYGYGGAGLADFRHDLDSLYSQELFLCQVMQSVYCHTEFLLPSLLYEEDIRRVKGDFLIRHVEECFSKWKRLPWLRNLSFDEFCDYVLPYRLENERLEDIPRLLDTLWLKQEDCRLITARYDDIYHSPHMVAEVMPPVYNSWVPWLPAPFETDFSLECYERALLSLYGFRAVGIPCALDAVPYWGNANGSHYWAAVVDPFFPERMPEELAFRKIPKVYRMMYRHEERRVWENTGRDFEFFEGAFWKDVTDRYIVTTGMEMDIPRKYLDCGAVYLCVFNRGEWKPVAGEFPCDGKARFDKLGYDIVYLPVCYKDDRQLPVGNPFILGRYGEVRELVCTDLLMDFTAYRKYPYNHQAAGGSSMVGTLFECANRPDFSDSEVFYKVEENTLMDRRSVICPDTAYRYWRIRPCSSMNLAELVFMRDGESVSDFDVAAMESADVCFDGDPLTYGSFRGVVDFDFRKAVRLDSVCYMPLNDGNGIFPGNIYELRYWKDGRWNTVCTERSEGYFLKFDSVPSGGLYWLCNLTTGTQERIFIVEDGKMKFY